MRVTQMASPAVYRSFIPSSKRDFRMVYLLTLTLRSQTIS